MKAIKWKLKMKKSLAKMIKLAKIVRYKMKKKNHKIKKLE